MNLNSFPANQENPDTKDCTLDDSIYVKLQKQQRYSDRKWISACQEPEDQDVLWF